jgi:hypothetical protein
VKLQEYWCCLSFGWHYLAIVPKELVEVKEHWIVARISPTCHFVEKILLAVQ